jgi:CheY-like chemotaxis protein
LAKILVVEDDESMNSILESTLTDVEHEVTTAFTGQEAIECCQSGTFDLVITDVRLPGADGVETVETLKRLQPSLKVIVITGYASEDTPVRAIRLNVDDYLFKPFSLAYFLQAVERVLQREEERESKRALFSKLFARFGLSMGDDLDTELEGLVKDRQEAFLGLFVGIRSGFLDQMDAAGIYTALDSLEAKFRNLLNAAKAEPREVRALSDSYIDIHERLALLKIGAQEDYPLDESLSRQVFGPLYEAVKEARISFEDLLYAPLLRKTPDSRFETLGDLLELKRTLWSDRL